MAPQILCIQISITSLPCGSSTGTPGTQSPKVVGFSFASLYQSHETVDRSIALRALRTIVRACDGLVMGLCFARLHQSHETVDRSVVLRTVLSHPYLRLAHEMIRAWVRLNDASQRPAAPWGVVVHDYDDVAFLQVGLPVGPSPPLLQCRQDLPSPPGPEESSEVLDPPPALSCVEVCFTELTRKGQNYFGFQGQQLVRGDRFDSASVSHTTVGERTAVDNGFDLSHQRTEQLIVQLLAMGVQQTC